MDPNTTPAMPPPQGTVANFVNPPSIAWVTIFTMVVYVVVVTPFVGARLYTRALIQKSFWWDDVSQVIALIGLYALVGMAIVLDNYGSGTDLWNVTMAQYATFNKLFGDFEIVARVSIFFTKLSILQMYLRYFCPTRSNRNWIWYATHAVIWFNLLYSIALVLVVVLQCVGKHPGPGQECINENMVLVGASVINVLTDLMVLVIPIAAVSRMRMSRKTKHGVLVVFGVGGLAILFSVARLGYQVPQNTNKNRTVVTAVVIILAIAEQAIGQIAGCMPILPALYRHVRHGSQSTTYAYGSDRYDSGNRKVSASYQSSGSRGPIRTDKQLPDIAPQRPSHNGRRDEEWQLELPEGAQAEFRVPAMSHNTTTPSSDSRESDRARASRPGAGHASMAPHTSHTGHEDRSWYDEGSEPGPGQIGVERSFMIDVQ